MEDINNELRAKYLGKKIEVPYISDVGSDKETIAGVCQNIGHNPRFPSWGVVVVIDRMPISNIDLSTIKILDKI